MVMLFDYHRGVDFAGKGLELQQPMFHAFDAASSRQFEKAFGPAGKPLDFRRFSKYLHPELLRYDFNLHKLLR